MIALYYQNFVVLIISMIILSIGNGYQPLVMNIVPAESVSRRFTATAISFVILTGEIIGGFAGPMMAGVLADKYSLTAPLWITAIAAFIAFICTFGIKETAPIKVEQSKDIDLTM
ncbi:MFS transporter [Metabacillus halosaccharovorans]|nr:MFS transporter [Metabacillus halosaccharovorans]MBU7591293.1 MFS transporter [Metabacillus halosaccharovorans]